MSDITDTSSVRDAINMNVSEEKTNDDNKFIGTVKNRNRKRKKRSLKQIERARKYRERREYLNYVNYVREAFTENFAHSACYNTIHGYWQHQSAEPMGNLLYIPGATVYQSAIEQVHADENVSIPPQEMRTFDQSFYHRGPWELPITDTIIHDPISNLRASAEVFVPATVNRIAPVVETRNSDISVSQRNSCKLSKVESLEPVSNLRASAEIFVPAEAKRSDCALENPENNFATQENVKPEDINISEDKDIAGEYNEPKNEGILDDHVISKENKEVNIIEGNSTSEDNIIAERNIKPQNSDIWEGHITDEEEVNIMEDNSIHNLPEHIATPTVSSSAEYIIHDDEENDMFGILSTFANSSLHCLVERTEISASKSTDEDFGYVYFSMSNLLK